ncbi:hypothetical protein ACWCWQ_21670 [Streptomyces sp. NPDC001571]
MNDATSPASLHDLLQGRLGSVMRIPVRDSRLTCRVCLGPLSRPGLAMCWQCRRHALRAGRDGWRLADRVIALTHSVDGEQSNVDMHRYKALASDEERFTTDAWQRLSLLVAAFGLRHAVCLDAASRLPVSRVTTVPSLRGRPGPHPLAALTAHLPRAWRPAPLVPALHVPEQVRRLLDPRHFTVTDPGGVAGRHVCVFEDTWVRGGHAQSAAAALHAAGAAEVTILTIARRLAPSYAQNRAFIEDRRQDYALDHCPVSPGSCPAPD